MTATILKSNTTHRFGFYVICQKLKENVFFSTYRQAKEFCEEKCWEIIRL